MPIYEYRCSGCGCELEKIQKFSDPPLEDCPDCEQATLIRLISPAGFRLKGGGWYETDFKNGNRRNVVDSAGDSDQKAGAGNDKPDKTSISKAAEKKTASGKSAGTETNA